MIPVTIVNMQDSYFSATCDDTSDSQMLIKPSNKFFPVAAKRYYLTAWFIFMVFVALVLILYTEPGTAISNNFHFNSTISKLYMLSFRILELTDAEHHLKSRLAELHVKENYLDFKYHSLEEETSSILGKLNSMMSAPNLTSSRVQSILKNISNEYSQSKFALKAPNIFNFLPHLSINHSSLEPYYRLSKNRIGGGCFAMKFFLTFSNTL